MKLSIALLTSQTPTTLAFAAMSVSAGGAKRGRDWHMTDEEKRLLERVRGMYGSTGKTPRGTFFFFFWYTDFKTPS